MPRSSGSDEQTIREENAKMQQAIQQLQHSGVEFGHMSLSLIDERQHSADLEAQLQAEQNAAAALQAEVGRLTDEVVRWKDEANALEVAHSALRTENTDLQDYYHALQSEFAACRAANDHLHEENRRLTAERDTLLSSTPSAPPDALPEQKAWSLVTQTLHTGARRRLQNDSERAGPAFAPTCASNVNSPLSVDFLAGLAECGHQIGDIVCDNGALNETDFILAFHGTSMAAATAVACGGFDPSTRNRQVHGSGEYFGSFETAESYGAQNGAQYCIFLSLLIKKRLRTSVNPHDKETYFIVDNPPRTDNKTYCLPFACIAVGTPFPTGSCTDPRCGAIPAGMPEGLLSTASAAGYEFESSSGWVAVDQVITDAIKEHLRRHIFFFEAHTSQFKYIIDLRHSTQKNRKSGKVRKLRAV